MLSSSLILLAAISATCAQSNDASSALFSFGPTTSAPLEDTPQPSTIGYTPEDRKDIPYDAIPFQSDNATWGRGPQSGYNQCNSTTFGPASQCQTAVVNGLDDFCLWGLPDLSVVANEEAAAVAYCTNDTYGARPIPAGSIYSAQMLYTPEYVQITGLLDQTKLNLMAGDYGGELDPVGADYRGNPLGGLMYSSIFSPDGSMQQIDHWTNFIGSDSFCLRICQPGSYNATRNCDHIYDRIGCQYNMPHTVSNNTFEQCYADVGLPVGIYTDSAGNLETYTQPPESLGAITTIPYEPVTPSSSNCSSPTAPPAAFLLSPMSAAASVAAVPTDAPVSSMARHAVRWARNGM